MLQKILKVLFPGTIASIENDAIDNYLLDLERAQIISQHGSLANYQDHLEKSKKLHDEMEMRERMEIDHLHQIMVLKTEIRKSRLTSVLNKGWGNGYVHLPIEHPFYGVHYDILNEYVDVNGGLTYSAINEEGDWVVGFDTAHSWDTPQMWPKHAVQAETDRLRDQLVALADEYTVEQVKQIVEDREDEYI